MGIEELPDIEADAVTCLPCRPSHYVRGGVECRDVERAVLSDSEVAPIVAHLWMSAFEYLWRWDRKGGADDLRKARECIDELIGTVAP